MSTFHICSTLPEAEARKAHLERSGYYAKIVQRDGQFHVDAAMTPGHMETKPRKHKKSYIPWKEPSKEELEELTEEENDATI